MSILFKRIFYIFISLAAIYLVVIMLTGVSLKSAIFLSKSVNFEKGTLIITSKDGNTHGFSVEIANTPASRLQGLMGRKTLADSAGMLLVFEDTKIVGLWMKDTHMPLDMIFINDSGQIVEIVENTEPLSSRSIIARLPTTMVLEINAGLAKKLNITVGDMVVYNFKP